MSDKTVLTIDFAKLGGPVYSGRARGKFARANLKLDEIDKEHGVVEIIIPESAYTVTSSFILGLLDKSVRKYGSIESFREHYKIRAPKQFDEIFVSSLSSALKDNRSLV